MKNLIILSIIILAGCEVNLMKMTSPAFKQGEKIPEKYTCDGENINPELRITETPEGTKTLALIMDDPDAPAGTWDHWIIYNIPMTEKIEENSTPGKQGKNSWGKTSYGGPCPPKGTHRYQFKLYALDKELKLEKPDKKQVEEAMKGHILGKAELTGTYSR